MTDNENASILSIQGVDVAYGRASPVVRDFSLKVPQGETFGLIGLNGVGKTTLIKAMLGLRAYQKGEITIGGLDSRHPDARKNLAYLPERFDPAWFLKGIEFLRFSVRLYNLPFDEAAARLLCEKLALDPAVLASRVQTYSKGMRQKLGLIGTLLTKCPLLILDEPMSGLDPQARALVKDVLGVARSGGQTIFFSSHILADMNEICDRVGVLHGGNLVYTGTPGGLIAAGRDDNIERAFLNLIHAGEHGQKAA
jgi:ABC-2 type transport system ATP-binding protein